MKPDPPCLLLLTLLSGTSKLRVRVPRMNAGGATIGAATRFSILSGRVLTPGSSGDGWWDGRCAAMPIVLPPSASRSKWQCFYYGRSDDKWNCGLPAFLPTGVSGLAESDDIIYSVHGTRTQRCGLAAPLNFLEMN